MQPSQQRGDEQPDAAATQVGEGHGVIAARLGLNVRSAFAAANLLDGQQQVAVPVEGVPGQVEVSVENEREVALRHRNNLSLFVRRLAA